MIHVVIMDTLKDKYLVRPLIKIREARLLSQILLTKLSITDSTTILLTAYCSPSMDLDTLDMFA
jgi:hypothetical protein